LEQEGEPDEEPQEEQESIMTINVSDMITVSYKNKELSEVHVTFTQTSPIFTHFFSDLPQTHPVFRSFFNNVRVVKDVRVRLSEDFKNFDSNPTTTVRDIPSDPSQNEEIHYVWPIFEPVF
jgi:hypothetical protein